MILLTTDRFEEHVTPPGHPESPARADVMHAVAHAFRLGGGEVRVPWEATDEQLLRVHTPAYLQRLREITGQAVMLDADTCTSPASVPIARQAAGAAVGVVDALLDSPAGTRALALVRPPGHHAEPDRAMGFCLLNNVAVAAAHARARGVGRVAVVDYDVHHGNGTQSMFLSDPSVLYVSTHQSPYYPGTGDAAEIGTGAGTGFTANFPMTAGATDSDYDHVFRAAVVPLLKAFRPELLLISAGFDAHEDDPLGAMRVSVEGYARLTAYLRGVAEECCGGRLGLVTEGGYDLTALRRSLEAVIDVLEAPRLPDLSLPVVGPRLRGEAAVAAARRELGPSWPGVF